MISDAVEWLFGSPPVAFVRGELALAAPWPVFFVAAGLVGVAVWFLLGYRSAGNRVGSLGRVLLALARAGAIALALLCLLRPQLVISRTVPQENLVAVLLDDSASMRIEDADEDGGTRAARLLAAFPEDPADDPEALGPRLEQGFVTRFFRFAQEASRLEAPQDLGFAGARTDLAGGLRHALDELASLPLAGVVLLTDGAQTTGTPDELDETLLELRARGVRVFPVPYGRSGPGADLELGAPDLPARVLDGSLVEVRARVRGRGLSGRTARFEVLDEGRILTQETVRFRSDDDEVAVTAVAPVEESGARRLRIRVASFPGEATVRNNERSALLLVEERPARLLYFEGQPRWEMKFLRRAVEADEGIQVSSLLRTAEGKFYRLGVSGPDELAGGFPDTREELFGYDAVILGSVEAAFFTQDQLNMLRDFVSQRGGGLLTLGGGRSYAEGGYTGTPVGEILPVALPEPSDESPPLRELGVSPTRAGASHPVVRLDPDAMANADRYRTLPMLSSVNRPGTSKPGAITLLEGAGADGATEPVLLFQRFGRGRVTSLTVQDLWLWQMDATVPVDDLTHEMLWRRLLRWLAADAPRRVEASVAPARALGGEPVAIRARVEDERFLAVNTASVEAWITGPAGELPPVPLYWTGEEDGEYAGSFLPDVDGLYRVQVRASTDETADRTPEMAEAWAEVGAVDDEFFGADTDRDLLGRIAEATGGRVFEPEDAEDLVTDLSISESGATVVERRDLWNQPGVFLLVFGLLAAEWCGRSLRGMA